MNVRSGFTLLEVVVALFILALVLTALLRTEIASFVVASRDSEIFDALILNIDVIDEMIKLQFNGEKKMEYGNFTALVKSGEHGGDLPVDLLKVEIVNKDEINCGELSVYHIRAGGAISPALNIPGGLQFERGEKK